MKNILSVLAASVVSVSVFANPVPQNRLNDYKTAFDLALKQSSLTCKLTLGQDSFYFMSAVDNATSVQINPGSQPVLVFSSLSQDGKSKTEVRITTSADYKSIVTMDGGIYVQGAQNDGDLENPVIVQGWQAQTTAVCK